jgi:hypothetical protein
LVNINSDAGEAMRPTVLVQRYGEEVKLKIWPLKLLAASSESNYRSGSFGERTRFLQQPLQPSPYFPEWVLEVVIEGHWPVQAVLKFNEEMLLKVFTDAFEVAHDIDSPGSEESCRTNAR